MFNPDQNTSDQQQYFQANSASQIDTGEIRTVFVSGLPDDVKEREIHNLFRFLPGFEEFKLTTMYQRPVAFASFQTREFAAAAIQQLHGVKYDVQVDYPLRVEFARANSKVKRNIAEGDNNQQQEKKRRIASYPTQSTYAYNYGAYDNYSYGYSDPYSQSSMHPIPLSQHSLSHPSRITPNTTLYVTGLDPAIGQNDLIAIFSTGSGFQRFRMGKDGLHCFLDYADSTSSSNALAALNGYQVGSSRLKVEYAKKKMNPPHPGESIISGDPHHPIGH